MFGKYERLAILAVGICCIGYAPAKGITCEEFSKKCIQDGGWSGPCASKCKDAHSKGSCEGECPRSGQVR